MKKYYLHENGDIVVCYPGVGGRPASKTKRNFRLSYSHYRKIASSAVRMFDERKNKITFWTYTFKDCIQDIKLTNKIISNHVENLRKNYGLKSFIWVAESQRRGAIHYHMLYDIPFVNILVITDSFRKTSAKFDVKTELNSVRFSPKFGAIVKSKERAVKYICKYVTKGLGEVFQSRNYSISHNILSKPIELTEGEFQDLQIFITHEYRNKYFICYFLHESYREYLRQIHAENAKNFMREYISANYRSILNDFYRNEMQKFNEKHLAFSKVLHKKAKKTQFSLEFSE